MTENHQKTHLSRKILLALFVITALYRLLSLQFLPRLFFFDQARDLILVEEMVVNLKPKLMGPSASGTNDTVYHGVVYYYFLAPLFVIAQGNPAIIQALLAIIISLAVIPITVLAYKMANSKFASLSIGIMYVFSTDAVIHNSWLSNPSLATLTVPVYLLSLWNVFYEKKWNRSWIVGLSLALSIQAAIFLGYLLFPLIVLFIYTFIKNRDSLKGELKNWVACFLLLVVGISSILLTQYKLFTAGIFKPSNLGINQSSLAKNLLSVGEPFSEKIAMSFISTSETVSVILFLISTITFLRIASKKATSFFILSLVTPALFIVFTSRTSIHSIIGFEGLLLFPLSYLIAKLINARNKPFVLGPILLVVYISMQILNLKHYYLNEKYPPAVQPGMYLPDQLQLIDETYQRARGESFTVSTFSNPYRYATTWLYLYHWYGKKTYGYLPKLADQDQTGMYGQDLLQQSKAFDDLHFAIIEPSLNTPEFFYELFFEQQPQEEGWLVSEDYFDRLQLITYKRR